MIGSDAAEHSLKRRDVVAEKEEEGRFIFTLSKRSKL